MNKSDFRVGLEVQTPRGAGVLSRGVIGDSSRVFVRFGRREADIAWDRVELVGEAERDVREAGDE